MRPTPQTARARGRPRSSRRPGAAAPIRVAGAASALAAVAVAAASGAMAWWWRNDAPAPTAPAAASTDCAANLAHGAPRVADAPMARGATLRTICRGGYALLHASTTRTALWVAERLEAPELGGREPRATEFLPDPDLPPAERAELSDYRRSGYDRGHLAPAGDFTTSAQWMRESFLLSNVVPQVRDHNAGVWNRLEQHVRGLASRRGAVHVLTGPAFDAQPPRIGRGVAVPAALWKVVYDPRRGRAAAWLIPNRPGIPEGDWDAFRVTVRSLERDTGLDFFPDLPQDEQDLIETTRSSP